MRARRVRRLPVTNDKGSISGIVSLSDLSQRVTKTGGLQQTRGDSRELLETLAVVSEPRSHAQVASKRLEPGSLEAVLTSA